MRAKKIGCGSPTCFLNFFPTLEPSKTIPHVTSSWGPTNFSAPELGSSISTRTTSSHLCSLVSVRFFLGVFGGRLPRGWVVLSGGSCGEKITMFLQEMDGFRILYVFWLVGWFCWGRWIACFFVRKFLEIETTADSFLVEDRIHFKPLWKGCLNPTKKRHILGGSSQEWSLLSPCWP